MKGKWEYNKTTGCEDYYIDGKKTRASVKHGTLTNKFLWSVLYDDKIIARHKTRQSARESVELNVTGVIE